MGLIPKILLQTSKNVYPDYVKKMWYERIDESWQIQWFDDEMIIQFFKDNPLPEFPKIIDVFYSFTDGAHRADLFRYYYLYLNGGFFIDSDCITHVHMNDIYSSEHDHIFTYSDIACNRYYHPEINSPTIFNGFLGCQPKSQIIYDALTNVYNTKPRLLQKQRLYFVYMLYIIAMKHKHNCNILFFEEHVSYWDAVESCTFDTSGNKLLTHFFSKGKQIPHKIKIEQIKK